MSGFALYLNILVNHLCKQEIIVGLNLNIKVLVKFNESLCKSNRVDQTVAQFFENYIEPPQRCHLIAINGVKYLLQKYTGY